MWQAAQFPTSPPQLFAGVQQLGSSRGSWYVPFRRTYVPVSIRGNLASHAWPSLRMNMAIRIRFPQRITLTFATVLQQYLGIQTHVRGTVDPELKPLHNVCEYLNALHVYTDEARQGVVRTVDAHHFCSHVGKGMPACLAGHSLRQACRTTLFRPWPTSRSSASSKVHLTNFFRHRFPTMPNLRL
jgi:hypothetical protein